MLLGAGCSLCSTFFFLLCARGRVWITLDTLDTGLQSRGQGKVKVEGKEDKGQGNRIGMERERGCD